jgi:hypothetical protein
MHSNFILVSLLRPVVSLKDGPRAKTPAGMSWAPTGLLLVSLDRLAWLARTVGALVLGERQDAIH